MVSQQRLRARAAQKTIRAVKLVNDPRIQLVQLVEWETERKQYCTLCQTLQPARQVERDEVCVYVCGVCGALL